MNTVTLISIQALVESHTISAFYLRNFTDTDPASRGHGKLWVRPHDSALWAPRSVRGTTTVADYYSPEGVTSGSDHGIEGILGRIESAAARVIYRLALLAENVTAAEIGGDVLLSKSDRAALALFIISTALRARPFHSAYRPVLTDSMAEGMARMHAEYSANPQKLVDEIQEYKARTGRADFDILQPEDFGSVDGIEFSRFGVVAMAFRPLEPMAIRLANETGWFFARADDPYHFVTSDNPAATAYSLGTPPHEVTFPLTRKLAFGATSQTPNPGSAVWRPGGAKLVEYVNLRTVTASGYWLSSKPGFEPQWLAAKALRMESPFLPAEDAKE